MRETPIRRPGSRGPLPTGKGTMIGVRLQPDLLAALDSLIAKSPDPKPSRPEAVRQVLATVLNIVARDEGAGT